MFHTQQFQTRLLLFSLLAIVVAPAAFADTVVIPNAQASVEGNEDNAFPFGRGSVFSNNPYRYQQVYNASGFGEQAGPITIDEIRFRPDSNNSSATTMTVGSIQVSLSSTTAAADGLNNVDFDQNIGSDGTVVYSGGLLWPIPTMTAAPRPFELAIPLTTSFVYDPSGGNLLLEIYNFSEVFPIAYQLDLENVVDETSRVVEVVIPGTGVHEVAPIGSSSSGLVTQFVYTVPEPSSAWAGVVAAFGLLALRRAA